MRKRIAVVSAVVVISAVVFVLALNHFSRISDRSLLREAVQAEKQGGRLDDFLAVFGQQVKQGYYDDAIETMRQYGILHDSGVAGFARVLAINGDVQSAKRMVNGYSDPMRIAGLEAIAIVQAEKGDIAGAQQTSASLHDKDKVREAICRYQVKSGDIKGAISTAEEAERETPGSGSIMLLVISESLSLFEPAQHEKIRKLAQRIRKEGIPKEFIQWAEMTDSDEPGCCGVSTASRSPRKHKVAYANSACAGVKIVDYSSEPWYLAIKNYEAGDVVGAEQNLRVSNSGWGTRELVMAAVKRGDINNALRFLDKLRSLEPDDRQGWLSDSARSIAAAWAKQDNSRTVVKWARSRSTSYERAMALLGVAEAIGHSR